MIEGVDINSPTWRNLRRFLDGRVHDMRDRLEASLPHDETTGIRGRIAELRALIAEAEHDPALPTENRVSGDSPGYG